jgi:site-specific DNA recombinase
VRELFTQYATGKASLRDLAQECKFSHSPIHHILQNCVYLDRVSYGKRARSVISPTKPIPFEVDGLHEPLVDEETFQKVQERLCANFRRQNGGPHARYLLSGLVRCGKCSSPMAGASRGNGVSDKRWVQYGCTRRVAYLECTQPTISGLKLEPQVKGQVMELLERVRLADVRWKAKEVAAEWLNRGNHDQQERSLALTKKREQLEERLSKLEDALLDGLIGLTATLCGGMGFGPTFKRPSDSLQPSPRWPYQTRNQCSSWWIALTGKPWTVRHGGT